MFEIKEVSKVEATGSIVGSAIGWFGSFCYEVLYVGNYINRITKAISGGKKMNLTLNPFVQVIKADDTYNFILADQLNPARFKPNDVQLQAFDNSIVESSICMMSYAECSTLLLLMN